MHKSRGNVLSGWLLSAAALLIDDVATAHDLRIEHVTVVSPERQRPLFNATVSIHNEKIAEISTGRKSSTAHSGKSSTEIIDGSGLFLAPGLIDSHVHLGDVPGMSNEQEQQYPEIARQAHEQFPLSYLYFGYTTLIDLNSTPETIGQWNASQLRPDTYFCGAAPVMDGYPMNYVPKPLRYRVMPYFLMPADSTAHPPGHIDPSAHTPQAVVAAIRAAGAKCVKTYFEHGFDTDRHLPIPAVDTIRALVRAAHQAHLPVLMHANSAEAQIFALDAGVDIIAHGLWNWGEPTETGEITPRIQGILDRIIGNKVGWQPTIQVMQGLRDLFNPGYLSDPKLSGVLPQGLIDWYRTPQGQWFHDTMKSELELPADADVTLVASRGYAAFAAPLARVESTAAYLAKRHAQILFGTDTPSAPTYGNPPGLNGWFEMQRLSEAGLSAAQIFQAATLSNAKALRLDGGVGTVQTGKRANLLLLKQDPTHSIEAYAGIVRVILGGRVIDPETLRANRTQASMHP